MLCDYTHMGTELLRGNVILTCA